MYCNIKKQIDKTFKTPLSVLWKGQKCRFDFQADVILKWDETNAQYVFSNTENITIPNCTVSIWDFSQDTQMAVVMTIEKIAKDIARHLMPQYQYDLDLLHEDGVNMVFAINDDGDELYSAPYLYLSQKFNLSAEGKHEAPHTYSVSNSTYNNDPQEDVEDVIECELHEVMTPEAFDFINDQVHQSLTGLVTA